MWRGGCRLNISVAASFDWRCLSGSTMAPFPHPAHRTGQADFPHPALGQDFTPLLSRATPSAVSEHSSELIGCPISMSFTTYCVCLELRSLPSTGITRLHWYYEPLRHPGAPGLSLAGVRLASLTAPRGFPCCVRFPCVHAAATTPAQRLGVSVRSVTQPYQPSPKGLSGRPAHRPFRGLLGVHSRYGLHTRAVTVFRDTLSEGFSHFVTSIAAPVASGWSGCRVGFAPTGKRRLFTAHTHSGHLRQHSAVGRKAINFFDGGSGTPSSLKRLQQLWYRAKVVWLETIHISSTLKFYSLCPDFSATCAGVTNPAEGCGRLHGNTS
jgi:hypothetical protein